ncbi:hypothetical protein N657DRAFT_325588 [Parathielavia appendiculata]|uniref:Uncharacterized protein n=1 Tax=Parathielavia appendiculata TaxID=2587402 RepID=A0AAN6TRM7_9PEZI|nr:hypothetical protein N657DRAFT_325588 [Parathielavia appendiculata]
MSLFWGSLSKRFDLERDSPRFLPIERRISPAILLPFGVIWIPSVTQDRDDTFIAVRIDRFGAGDNRSASIVLPLLGLLKPVVS